ncbi:MAG: RNA pyrophosphohydrolase [Acidobacteria bacterium]|nr:RNA pyrophosphohydrolase [Acidobacteriota bacterium]
MIRMMETEALCAGDGPYRPNVAALILRRNGPETLILMGERLNMPGAWQWPQGGIDEGEDALAALHREVLEETGIDRLTVLGQLEGRYRYRFPVSIAARFVPYIGQTQTYFIATTSQDYNPSAVREPEFMRMKWLPLDRAGESGVWFKADVYNRVLKELKRILPSINAKF